MSVHSKMSVAEKNVRAVPAGQMAKNVTRINAFQTDVAFYLPNPSDHIQKIIRATKKFYEQSMLAEIGPLLPENATVADVGANIGNHSVFFAKILGAKVLSFEPNPEAYSILEASVALNDLSDTVELHKVAVGAAEGRGEINNVSDVNLGMAQVVASDSGSVNIQTLDDIIGERHVDLIKIDVEGMECEVLKGAGKVLQRCKPLLIAEAATLEELVAIEALLRPQGYRKVQRYNDTPTFLFKFGLETDEDAGGFTKNLLDRHKQTLPKTSGIYAGMATVAGNEVALRAAVMSLLPQVDGLFLYLNGYSEVPGFLKGFDKITCQLDPEGTRYGDAGKFWGLTQVQDAIYLTCDDDILYPQDYVERMVQELAECKAQAVLCVHGSLLVQPMEQFYSKGARSVLHFAGELIRRRQVHVPGTGTCAFHSATVYVTLDQFKAPNMADIWLTQHMSQQGIPAFAVPHKSAWLRPLKVNRPNIYEASANGAEGAYNTGQMQTEILQSLMPLSLLHAEAEVVCVSLEKDGNVLTALNELPLKTRDPIVFVKCDAVTEDIKAKIAQSSCNWETHLVARNADTSAACKALAAKVTGPVVFWKVERRRLVEDAGFSNLTGWLLDAADPT